MPREFAGCKSDTIQRGEVWWAALSAPIASEPGYRRPVLVVQANEFSESRIHTVIVVAMTSNLKLAAAPGNVLCRAKDTGLPKDSVVNISQVVTLDKIFLKEKAGKLSNRLLEQVETGLRRVLVL